MPHAWQYAIVVDEAGTSGQVLAARDDIANTLRSEDWYPDAPAHVDMMLDDLQTALDTDQPWDGETIGLGIRIEPVVDPELVNRARELLARPDLPAKVRTAAFTNYATDWATR